MNKENKAEEESLEEKLFDIVYEGDIKYKKSVRFVFETDYKFWSIPFSFFLNFHTKTLEINLFCFGLYFDLVEKRVYIPYKK